MPRLQLVPKISIVHKNSPLFIVQQTKIDLLVIPIASSGTSDIPKYRQDLVILLPAKVLNYTYHHVLSALTKKKVPFSHIFSIFEVLDV